MKNTYDYMEFTDDLVLGIDSIDNQHREIVRIYNMFVTEVNHIIVTNYTSGFISNQDLLKIYPNIEEIISALSDYVIYHFSEEERFMRSINYNDYEQHVFSHIDIREEIYFYKDALKENTFDIVEFIEFFYKWIVGHIKKSDADYMKKYREYKKEHPDYRFDSSTFN